MSIFRKQHYIQNLPKMTVKFKEVLNEKENETYTMVNFLCQDTQNAMNDVGFCSWNKICSDVKKMKQNELYDIWYELETKVVGGRWATIATAKKIRKHQETLAGPETETQIEQFEAQIKQVESFEQKIDRILSEIQKILGLLLAK